MAKALIFISNGTEEMEFTITYDSFVRAGVESTSVGVDVDSYATCTRGVKIIPDNLLSDLSDDDLRSFDIVIIPGGAKGANTLKDNKRVQQLLGDTYEKSGKFIGTICAGSLAVKTSDIANGKRITSHPSVKSDLEKDYDYSEDRVVQSNNLVSSRGPGTAFEFALTLIELSLGKDKREAVAGPMIL